MSNFNVVTTTPGLGQDNVSTPCAIQVMFDEEVNFATISTETFSNMNDVEGDFALSEDHRTVYFYPRPSLSPDTLYTFKISSHVESVQGYDLGHDHVFSFLTRDKLLPIVIENLSPSPGTSLTSRDRLSFDTVRIGGIPFRLAIAFQFGSSCWELAWDGDTYLPLYTKSKYNQIENGSHFDISREGGWPEAKLGMRYFILT